MAKVIFRHGERVKCPHDPDTRRELARFALDQRERVRELRLALSMSDAPADVRAAALAEYGAGLRVSYRELREKMEIFAQDLLDQFERHIGRLAAGERSELTVAGVPLSQMRAGRMPKSAQGRPPWARRGRRR